MSAHGLGLVGSKLGFGVPQQHQVLRGVLASVTDAVEHDPKVRPKGSDLARRSSGVRGVEDDEGAEHYAPSSGFEDNFEMLTKQKKIRKPKKKKPKVATIEFLEPTKREENMAGAYGGMAMGEIRRPGIKYDRDRLANSKKFRVATADEPKVRAQLA